MSETKQTTQAADTATATAEPQGQPIQTVGEAIGDQVAAQLAAEFAADEPAANRSEPDPEVVEEAAGEKPKAEIQKAEIETVEADGDEAEADPGSLEQDENEVPELLANTEDEDEDDPVAPGTKRRFKRRLNKEVARRKALEAELEQLKAKAEPDRRKAPEPGEVPASFVDGLPEVQSARTQEREAAERLTRAKGLLRQMSQDPDQVRETLRRQYGVEPPNDDGALQAQLEDARDQFAASHAEAVASRASLVTSKTQQVGLIQRQADMRAAQLYPWMNDPESAEYQLAQEVMAEDPRLNQRPDRGLVIGRYVTGRMAEQAKLRPPKPKVEGNSTKAPPKIPSPKAVPRGAGSVKPKEDKMAKLAQAVSSGDGNAMEEALAGVL